MGHRVDDWMRVTLSGLAHELWAAVPVARGPCVTCFGHLDMRAQTEVPSALRTDTPRATRAARATLGGVASACHPTDAWD